MTGYRQDLLDEAFCRHFGSTYSIKTVKIQTKMNLKSLNLTFVEHR